MKVLTVIAAHVAYLALVCLWAPALVVVPTGIAVAAILGWRH